MGRHSEKRGLRAQNRKENRKGLQVLKNNHFKVKSKQMHNHVHKEEIQVF